MHRRIAVCLYKKPLFLRAIGRVKKFTLADLANFFAPFLPQFVVFSVCQSERSRRSSQLGNPSTSLRRIILCVDTLQYVSTKTFVPLSLCSSATLNLKKLRFRNCRRHSCSFTYKNICHQNILCIFI